MPASASIPVTRAKCGASFPASTPVPQPTSMAARRWGGRFRRIQPWKCSLWFHGWRALTRSSHRRAPASTGLALSLTSTADSLPKSARACLCGSVHPDRPPPGTQTTALCTACAMPYKGNSSTTDRRISRDGRDQRISPYVTAPPESDLPAEYARRTARPNTRADWRRSSSFACTRSPDLTSGRCLVDLNATGLAGVTARPEPRRAHPPASAWPGWSPGVPQSPWMCSMPARAAPGHDLVESGLSALQSAGHMPMCRAARLDRAGRSCANRCRRRPWRCEPFRSSCGRDRMRAGPHRGPCLRCAGTPSTSCLRRGRQVLALW